jgi:guanylate kinase
MEALITITGPSCSGKTTLQNWLFGLGKFERIISFTTRPQREGEQNGVDYFFQDKPMINALKAQGQIAEFVEFNGNYYGILGSELKNKLAIARTVAVVEPHGVIQLHDYCNENRIRHFAIYLTNPPIVTTARFLKRLKDNPNASPIDYAKRIVSMVTEEQGWMYKFPYNLVFTSYDSSNELEVQKQTFEALNKL